MGNSQMAFKILKLTVFCLVNKVIYNTFNSKKKSEIKNYNQTTGTKGKA